MTTFQKIIKYLALAFAIFLSISIISGICSALFTVANLFGENTESEIVNHIKSYGNGVINADF